LFLLKRYIANWTPICVFVELGAYGTLITWLGLISQPINY